MNEEKGKCFRCGMQNEESAKFCRGCGNTLQEHVEYKSQIEISRVEIERVHIGTYELKTFETPTLEEKVQVEQTPCREDDTLKKDIDSKDIDNKEIEIKKQPRSSEQEKPRRDVTIERSRKGERKSYKKIILWGIAGVVSLCLLVNFFLLVRIPKEEIISTEVESIEAEGVGTDYSTRRFLSFNYSGIEGSNCGRLYFHSANEEIIVVAEEVLEEPFLLGNASDNIVYMQKDGVYITDLRGEAYKIMEYTNIVELTFTEDERYLVLRSEEDKYYIYDVQHQAFKEDKEASQTYKKQGDYLLEGDQTCYGTYVDTLHNDLYYIDVYNTLYRLEDFGKEEKIAEDVWDFRVLNNKTLVYESFEEEGSFYVCTLGEQVVIEALGFYMGDMSEIAASSQGEVILGIGAIDEEAYYEESYLYIKDRGESPIQITEHPYGWEYVEAIDTLYYLDHEDNLISVKISKKGKNYDKKEIAEDVFEFDVSEDGHNIGIRTWEDGLYLYRGDQMLELGEDVKSYNVYNSAIIYATYQDKLHVATDMMINGKDKLSANQNQITDLLRKQVIDGENERYIIYLEEQWSETGRPIRLKRYDLYSGESIELLQNINEMDCVLWGQTKYYKDLREDEVLGYYICNDENFALSLDKAGDITLYVEGEEVQRDQFIYSDIEEKNSVQIELMNSYFLSRNGKDEYNSEENVLDLSSTLSKKSEVEYTLANYEYCYKLLRITQEAFEAYRSDYLN